MFVFVYPADKTQWDYWWLLTIASLHRENCSWMMASLTVSVCVWKARTSERGKKRREYKAMDILLYSYFCARVRVGCFNVENETNLTFLMSSDKKCCLCSSIVMVYITLVDAACTCKCRSHTQTICLLDILLLFFSSSEQYLSIHFNFFQHVEGN